LSYNSFGSYPHRSDIGRMTVEHMSLVLAHNHTLTYLDLTSNNYGPEDIPILASGLLMNKTLLQLSFEQNAGTLDSKGFLHPINARRDKASTNPLKQKPNWMNDFEAALTKGTLVTSGFMLFFCSFIFQFCIQENKGCKWVDDGWSEECLCLKFDVVLKQTVGLVPGQMVLVHLAFDDWLPDRMSWDPVSDSWVLYRVCPPGKFEYYFTGGNDCPFLSDDIRAHGSILAADVHESKLIVRQPPSQLKHLHWRQVEKREGIFWLKEEYPRREWYSYEKPEVAHDKERPKEEWTLDRSNFSERAKESASKTYVDTESLLHKAAASDWKRVVPKLER
jgi:hypothetical protein